MDEAFSRELSQNQEWANQTFGRSADFYAKPLQIGRIECCLMLFDGLSSVEKLWQILLRYLADECSFRKGEQLFDQIGRAHV